MAKLKRVPLTGGEIVTAAPVGLSGGFGFGQDGSAIPVAGRRLKKKFKTDAKDMYTEITVSDKVLKLAKGDTDSIINELDDEIKGAYETAEWNVGRSIFGDGTGILATVTADSTTDTVAVSDAKFLKEGLTVDLFAAASTDPETATPKVTARINSIDRAAKTVVLDRAVNAAEGDFFTVQKSFGRELPGIGAICNDDIPEIYGVDKAQNPF